MNNTCPRCGHVYNVSDRDVGKRIPCKKCRTPLLVDSSGIRLDEPPPATVAEPAFVFEESVGDSGGSSPRRRSATASTEVLSALISPYAIPTYVMGLGAVLVILFLFLPLMDQAKVASRNASIMAGQAHQNRLEQEYIAKKDKGPSDDEAHNKARESWNKEQLKLQDDLTDAQVSAAKWHYWYLWGQLFGFLLTALPALAYMAPQMPRTRRVVGAIVFTAVLLLVFLRIVFAGNSAGVVK